ncbi:MAG TPA: hypothetical protein VFE47_07825 [Tepidisphaeraceae bacterium]|nr:hypothetical protein [Tepidisphaeraceae bacterium]
MRPLSRNLIAWLIAVIGACASGGCVFIPAFGVTQGQDVSKSVGTADSKAPLRVGLSTRNDVIKLLGEPKPAADDWILKGGEPKDSHKLIYYWQTLQWYGGMLLGPCSGLGWLKDYHSLAFHFDNGWVIDQVKQQ